VNGEEHPQCVACGEVLKNNSLNTRNLCRHLTTIQASLANIPLEYFELKLLETWKKLNVMKTTIIISTAALLVSFDISYVVAKTKKPHTT
jgi:hypothetical protein